MDQSQLHLGDTVVTRTAAVEVATPVVTKIFQESDKANGPEPTPARPLWIIFHGIVDDAGIGSLIQLEPIQRSLMLSAADLSKTVKFDLMSLVQDKAGGGFHDVQRCFLSVVAVQIAMVDVLLELGVRVSGFIGYSLGELASAYLDGCLTREETLLVAYWRGKAILSTDCGLGDMVSVNLCWDEAQRRCPAGIYPACHNSADNLIVAGPAELMRGFQEELQSQGIEAKKVGLCGYAFHSKYVAPALPFLKPELERILGDRTRERSPRWVTTSRGGMTLSVDYLLNNIVSPVYFCEAYKQVPDNVVLLEVGPKNIITWALSDVWPASVTQISSGKRPGADALTSFRKALTDLSVSGIKMDTHLLNNLILRQN